MKRKYILGLLIMGLFSFWSCKSDKKSASVSEVDIEMKELVDKSFSDFNNRKIYDQLTIEILDDTPDHELIQTVFDNIETNFEVGEQYTIDKIEKLSLGKQAIFSIWMLQAEVNNGGFNQFYYNSTGQFAKMAKDGLELIEALKYAKLAEQANTTYSTIKDGLATKDKSSIESFSKSYQDNPLNKLDDQFYLLDKIENLDSIQIQYIRLNKGEFVNE